MKKLFMLLGILALSTGMVVAQDTAAQDQQQPANQDQQAQQPADQPAGQAEQPADANADANAQTDTADQGALPQTASPLPLLALLGLGSMAAGIASRRK
jgi:hypothetical protein